MSSTIAQGIRILRGLALVVSLALPMSAQAAERRAIVTEGADYFGRDIGILKDVPVEDCEAACVADTACKAFTYNTKARWCFKKADFGDLRTFPGAIAGRIVEGVVAGPDLEAARRAELDFLSSDRFDAAAALLTGIGTRSVVGTLDDALAAAAQAAGSGNTVAANELYKNALRLAPERFDVWELFTSVSLAVATDDWSTRSRMLEEGYNGAILAYLRATDDAERVRALNLITTGAEKQEAWSVAIKAARASLAVAEDATVAATLDRLIGEHGFRVVSHQTDTSSQTPRICAVFSDPIASNLETFTDFVAVTGGDGLAVEADTMQVCASGVGYGERYQMTLRQGLPAADGVESLHKSVTLDFYVTDRKPEVRFVGRGYVLPRSADATIPVVSVNVETIEADVVRIGDRSLVSLLDGYTFLNSQGSWFADDVASSRGERVWTGKVAVTAEINREVTTAIPVGEVVKTLKPGIYVMLARAAEAGDTWGADATQWFLVSDMGLGTMTGNDGLHAVVRSLGSAAAVTGAEVTLVARNNEVLGTTRTDANGYARFEPALTRGTGGNSPALLTVAGADGDFNFIDLTSPAFDLTDRGVTGRPAPLPVDVFATPERGIYRPGETVHLTALTRDPSSRAIVDLPLTVVVSRPDGAEYQRTLTEDEGSGGRTIDVRLSADAMRGTWQARFYTDPDAGPLSTVSFQVEDFLPERIDFGFDPGDEPLVSGSTRDVEIRAEWLYGAPAANLAVEGEVFVTAAAGLAAAPGYRFGLEGEEFTPVAEPVSGGPTAEDGTALVTLMVPDVSQATVPLQAAVHVRVLDTNGRPVERRKTLPVTDDRVRVGVKPAFDRYVEENGRARFDVALFDGEGARVAGPGLRWVLSAVDTRYQWYNADGSWDYKAIETTRRVADGTVDVPAGVPAVIEASVQWGEYRLEVSDAGGAVVPVSTSFYAGWYVPPSADPAPDMLEVSFDKERYAIGDTATARIHKRFPGVAVVSVIDDRLIDMKTVEVGEDGATVQFPVTSAWGPGAYVTAELLRPLDRPAGRMPQRALGVAWAAVDPGDRLLDVSVDVADEIRPRGPMPIEVAVANAGPDDAAYVTIAAVDVGILNMTQFETPAPEAWYFARRTLGMEIRDVYGRLIDTTIGSRGEVRSGGDGSGIARLVGPPPTEALVAFFSGPVRTDADGKARVTFDLPEFNGTVRVMVMAWSAAGVGHAEREVKVRDPVVVMASLPNFLAPGDTSRLRLDLTHLTGPSGEFRLSVEPAGSLVRVGPGFADRPVSLNDGDSAEILVPLEAGTEVGDETVTVTLAVPGGDRLVKTLTLPVRALDPPATRVSEVALAAKTGQLTIDRDLLSDFVPGTGLATVTVGGVGGIDLPGLVHALDRYPYGCAEQITSRALPLVYLDEVILAAGLTGEESVRDRVQKAIADVLVKQASNGSFGLWAPSYDNADLWLNAYVTDFLTRAREKGYDVPAVAFDLAVTNLKNQLAYAPDFSSGGEAIAYALYVLARNGRASIGDLRYYGQSKLDAFSTPLAKAQVGAALALYGDRANADAVFRAALDALAGRPDSGGWRADYGTDLRDGAALLTLASESKTDSVDLDLLAQTVRELGGRDSTRRSTQEQAWMLLAAHSLLTDARKPLLDVAGKTVEGIFTARYDADDLATSGPVVIRNRAGYDTDARVTLTGIPVTPEPAGGDGYFIDRRAYDLEGNEIDLSKPMALGQRLVMVLTVDTDDRAWSDARLIIDDPLPAGFVIDNPNLLTGADVANLSWLTLEEKTAASEFRADRFITAYDRRSDQNAFSVGYMVRAVAPGSYAWPAAVVEDMYRPYLAGRTATGRLVVEGPMQ
jgi:uncharacterized protein YfaS (alpha-2-macroglobulin family)